MSNLHLTKREFWGEYFLVDVRLKTASIEEEDFDMENSC